MDIDISTCLDPSLQNLLDIAMQSPHKSFHHVCKIVAKFQRFITMVNILQSSIDFIELVQGKLWRPDVSCSLLCPDKITVPNL